MFRTISGPVPAWESSLPPELLRLPEELARVDALLDDPAFFAPFAPYFHPVLGRPSTPIECYLRLMFLKFRYRLGYESLFAEVSDSISWRRFCRIGLDATVPHPTTLMKLTTRCGEGAVAGLNEALLARAAGQKLLRTARVRADTTVIPANVAYPTDAGLLAKAVGKLVRAAAAGAGRAGGHHRADCRAGGPGPVPAGRADARRRDPAGQPARPRRAADPQGTYRPSRGVRVQGPGHRQRRRHHPGLRRPGRQPPDAPQLAPAITRIVRRAGRTPRSVTADRGYGELVTERELQALGYAPSPSRAEPGPQPPAAPPGMPAASAPSSSGGPAARAGSATSSAGTAGTAPGWTAATEPRSGAGTGYSPTTWSRSAPLPADRPGRTQNAASTAAGDQPPDFFRGK